MTKIKNILNLYCGIGGNRKLWSDDFKITAVEYKQEIADVYKSYFPKDKVIVTDAHKYLLEHYKEYDFIWSSPPCPSHSDIRRCGVHKGQYSAIYPEMSLYQEIILLKHFAKGFYIVENVKPYYEPLIRPDTILHRHFFWCNFPIQKKQFKDDRRHSDINGNKEVYGFDLKNNQVKDKRKLLRNMVNPEIGLYILNEAQNIKTYEEKQQKLL